MTRCVWSRTSTPEPSSNTGDGQEHGTWTVERVSLELEDRLHR